MQHVCTIIANPGPLVGRPQSLDTSDSGSRQAAGLLTVDTRPPHSLPYVDIPLAD